MSEDAVWLCGYAGAGQYLGVHADTVRSYVKRRLLRAFRIRGSRLIRFKRADLDALMVTVEPEGQARTRLEAIR